MQFKYVKIVVTAPSKDADTIREALGSAGAGIVGNYRYCSFSVTGTGRFTPNDQAKPHLGGANRPEAVAEERIEVTCDYDKVRQVIEVLRTTHPYEEPAIDIYPLIDEGAL